jgi:hypothetical protein
LQVAAHSEHFGLAPLVVQLPIHQTMPSQHTAKFGCGGLQLDPLLPLAPLVPVVPLVPLVPLVPASSPDDVPWLPPGLVPPS